MTPRKNLEFSYQIRPLIPYVSDNTRVPGLICRALSNFWTIFVLLEHHSYYFGTLFAVLEQNPLKEKGLLTKFAMPEFPFTLAFIRDWSATLFRCSPPFILNSKFVISSAPGYHHLLKMSPWAAASFPIPKSFNLEIVIGGFVKNRCYAPSAPFAFLIGTKNGVFSGFIHQSYMSWYGIPGRRYRFPGRLWPNPRHFPYEPFFREIWRRAMYWMAEVKGRRKLFVLY